MTLTSINPATEQILKTFEEWNQKAIDTHLEGMVHEWKQWKKTTFTDRQNILLEVANLLSKHQISYARLISTEMGKPIRQAEAEVEKCAWVCRYYAKNSDNFLKKEYHKTDAEKSYIQFLPLGIILGIMPWNYPFWQVFRWAVPTIMAGNAALLKHSSNVPQCALALEKIFTDAGLTDHIFKNMPIRANKVSQVIKDDRVAALSLTGSTAAGSAAAEVAGKYLKKTVLELGGSDPFIVCTDADIELCTDIAVKARMINNGQSCIAAKRFIVLRDVFEEFQETVIKKIEQLQVGSPLSRTTDVGPLARKDIMEQLQIQVEESIEKGAVVMTGGEKCEGSGYFYLPTVLSNVNKKMPVYHEETFGPVAALIKVKDVNEAITIANDTPFGLGASIWTNNNKKAELFSSKLEAGNVFINEMVKSDPRLPFGGIKKSGYGRELSFYGIREFVNIQTVYVK